MHLAKRFFGMLDPRGPAAVDQAWIDGILSEREAALWIRMSRADRRHAAGVARRVEAAWIDQFAVGPPTEVLVAALLHDVGKIESGLGVYGRVIATLCGMVATPDVVRDWQRTRGFTRRVALYLRHPQIGSEMLALAGSHPLAVTWAAEHQSPPSEWTIDPTAAQILSTADDD